MTYLSPNPSFSVLAKERGACGNSPPSHPFQQKIELKHEDERDTAAPVPLRRQAEVAVIAGCSSTHRVGRVTPKGTESHPLSTFTPHGSGAPTRLEPSPGNWLPTWMGPGMLHPPSLVGHGVGRAARDDNRGQRQAHPQPGLSSGLPSEDLGTLV